MWKTIRRYIWWTDERGSLHYDVMVTLILAFIFGSPYFLNFKDQPPVHVTHPNQVVITPAGTGQWLLEISADQASPEAAAETAKALVKSMQPEPGRLEARSETVRDPAGKVTGYKVWVRRP
jgi:hypothetical protein